MLGYDDHSVSRVLHPPLSNFRWPVDELVRYAVDLRSSTHGAGSFTRSFGHYEPMPEDVARSIPAREP